METTFHTSLIDAFEINYVQRPNDNLNFLKLEIK